MAEIMRLLDFPEGELGEIVSFEDATITEKIGADIGMSVIVLNKAVECLIQVGYNQVQLGKDYLKKIMVKQATL